MSATETTSDDNVLQTAGTTGVLGYRLRRAQLNLFQEFLSIFGALNLRPAEYSVLTLVDENPGRKQTEIAEVLGIKRANFVPLLHGLEERNLVERRPSDSDRRANALHLTRDGAAFLAKARTLHDRMEQDFTDRLGGEAQRKQLIALLNRLD
jgi:DNA-binding MarR family transcriptional regulator